MATVNERIAAAYQAGDTATLNNLLAQNQITAEQAKAAFNLSDADIAWVQSQAGGRFYEPAAPTYTGADAAIVNAYQGGDVAALNNLLSQNKITAEQAKSRFNLSDADLAWIQNNVGGQFYNPTPAPVPKPVPAPQITKQAQFQNFLMQPNLTDAQIAAEMMRLGITTGQASNLTGLPEADVNSRFNTVAPFANTLPATFSQNFQNYTSIPIGAQYNPGVTAGGVTPYSQVMGQMRPFANPYAGVMAGLSMGGYDPSIYDPNLFSNFVRERADKAAADAASSAAQQAAVDYGAFDGGLITKVMGPKPPTPDDGAMFVQKGEYIVKKDAVNKYGKGLLDKVNEGKIPAKKMKSLLG